MPRAWRGGGGDAAGGDMGNESTASFDPADVHGGGGAGRGREEEPFYANLAESRSREVFFDPTRGREGQGEGEGQGERRYDDPYETRREG